MMEAGQELDALMATEVMGWEALTVGYFGIPESETPRQVELKEWLDKVGIESVGDYYIDVDSDFLVRADDMWERGWHPSTDWSAAGQVVEKMGTDGFSLVIECQAGWEPLVYSAVFGPKARSPRWYLLDKTVWFESLPLAICVAAHETKGVEVE